MTQYVFDNAAEAETEVRFRSLGALFDPTTQRIIDSLQAVGARARCLEVGGGGGSLVRWLSERVASQGHILVTDIDPRFLTKALSGLQNVELLRHDIGTDPLPTAAFDFVHTRLVLEHVPDWGKGLDNMVNSLRSGGTVLVEDFDLQALDWTESAGSAVAIARYSKLAVARMQIFREHRVHFTIGRQLPAALLSRGIQGIGFEPTVTIRKGASAAGELEKANLQQLRDEILTRSLLTPEEFDDAIRVFDDPSWSRFSPLMVSAWGRKP